LLGVRLDNGSGAIEFHATEKRTTPTPRLRRIAKVRTGCESRCTSSSSIDRGWPGGGLWDDLPPRVMVSVITAAITATALAARKALPRFIAL
jgi:hypothetical protein